MSEVRDTGVLGTVLDAARLLVGQVRHWLPMVAVLAMIGALPEALIEHYLPDMATLLHVLISMDTEDVAAAAGMVVLLLSLKFVVTLVALMFAFVILADLSAGRTPDVWAGMRRLASWRLQFAWLLAGVFEQTAISLWFMGGALLLVPVGLATTVAYEEDNGFQSFPRALRLGLLEMGSARPGVRIAIAVTLGFLLGAVVSGVISVVSCATSAASVGPAVFDLLKTVQTGQLPTLPGGGLPADSGLGWGRVLFVVLVSPVAVLPTVFMITVQQLTYWQARRFDDAACRAAGHTGRP
ncbi:MAG: hypothetical protein EXR69_00170 [Myxococcales bacterium]|nr:hypothetical protein [Myxococcales bacterium]